MPWVHKVTSRGTISEHDHAITEVASFPKWNKNMKTKHKDADGNTYSKPISVTKKSEMNHLHAANQVKRHLHFLWQSADQAPYFRQPIVRVPDPVTGKLPAFKKGKKNKPITTRSNRALSGHTLRTLASGAAASVGAQLAADCARLRIEDASPEDAKFPFHPNIQPDAAFHAEAAWIAYCQELFQAAEEIRNMTGSNGNPKHSKVTPKCCQAAAEIVNKRYAMATAFVPESVAFRKPAKSIKKKSVAGKGA